MFLRTLRIQYLIFPIELAMIYATETFKRKKFLLHYFYQFSFIIAISYSCAKTGYQKLVFVLLKKISIKYHCAIY